MSIDAALTPRSRLDGAAAALKVMREVAVAAGMTLVLAQSAHAATITSMALVTPEQPRDFGWNQQGVEGAAAAAKAHGLKFEAAAGVGYGDVRPTLRNLVDDGVNFIIAHGPYASQAEEIAAESKIYVTVDDEKASKPPYVVSYSLGGQEGAYLAGVLAAKMTKTGILGVVTSSESPEWNAQTAGFVLGARATNPSIVVHYAVIGPEAYSDVAGAKRTTESMLASGPDIILGQGDGATFGMLQAIENAKPPKPDDNVWFIDVIGDKTSIDKGHLLSSVVWNFEPIFSSMIDSIQKDTFGTDSYALKLKDDSVKLLHTKHIPDDVWADVMKVRDDIIAGKITVPEVFDPQEVRKIVAEK